MYGLLGLGDAPLGIVATMPPLPPSACSPSQTYIAPGSAFTSGPMVGIITSTGACQDATGPQSSGAQTWAAFFTASSLFGLPNWVLIAGGAVALFAFSGQGGRR
jgi:hypothetical protein